MLKRRKNSKTKFDFTEGSLFLPFFKFGISILISGFTQSLYNTADRVIIGKFSGDPNALAAMSSTGTLYAMLITTVLCMSVGSTITLAKAHGEKNNAEVSNILHTSITFAAVAGLVLAVAGQFVSMPILRFLKTKPELIEAANVYICVIFMGLPFSAVANYSDAALRARGRGGAITSIYVISGVINVMLNILFVAVFKMSVFGVAIATVISQAFSAVSALALLHRDSEEIAFRLKKMRIDPKRLREIMKIGVPNSIQSIIASLGSFVTSSTLNTLSIEVLRGNAAVGSSITLISPFLSAFTVSAVSVAVAQNYGAKNYKRMRRVMYYSALCFSGVLLCTVPFYVVFPKFTLSFFMDKASETYLADLACALPIILPTLLAHAATGFQYIFSSSSRSLGHSLTPLVAGASSIAFSVLWCMFVFPHFGTPGAYFIAFPLGSGLSLLINFAANFVYMRRVRKECLNYDIKPTACRP